MINQFSSDVNVKYAFIKIYDKVCFRERKGNINRYEGARQLPAGKTEEKNACVNTKVDSKTDKGTLCLQEMTYSK